VLKSDDAAAALESAAAVRLPLPDGLRRNLRAIALREEPGAVLPFPVPRLAVPEALAARLRAVAPARRAAPPAWVLDSRLAVAASALLAVLLGPLIVPAAGRGQQALSAVRAEVAPILDRAGDGGRRELASLRLAAASGLERLDAGLTELSDRFHASLPDLPEALKNPKP
jgi:hypothetical protein